MGKRGGRALKKALPSLLVCVHAFLINQFGKKKTE